ncbi:hypothetical protein EVAR_34043_1 [Eumeta japonica]|uniref:Uncharacterized protein n=1 Tax=Eumeta variegata TaxID=151549 RepID=A0A4C1VSW6_EUMVA|nr:hypothetical protein EVAR_34043_1 [Eumeta japonica]
MDIVLPRQVKETLQYLVSVVVVLNTWWSVNAKPATRRDDRALQSRSASWLHRSSVGGARARRRRVCYQTRTPPPRAKAPSSFGKTF